jgi:predicted CoA-binding protein
VTDEEMRSLLRRARRIAVVGLSPDPSRPSHRVAAYLVRQGYDVVPVRPDGAEVLGRRAAASLAEAGKVDIVDVFRRPEAAAEVVEEAARLGLPAVWLQEGIASATGRARAEEAGLAYVEDRCIMKEHARLGVGPVDGGSGRAT